MITKVALKQPFNDKNFNFLDESMPEGDKIISIPVKVLLFDLMAKHPIGLPV